MGLQGFLARTDAAAVQPTRRALEAVVAITIALAAVHVLANSVVDSPVRPDTRTRANLLTVIPEGWAFFTRNPREAQVFVFGRHNGTWRAWSQRHAAASNVYGFGRVAREQMVELMALQDQVSENKWAVFPPGTNPTDLEYEAVTVRNPGVHPRLCGELLLVEREPVPWAWSTAAAPVRMGGKALRMVAMCEKANHL